MTSTSHTSKPSKFKTLLQFHDGTIIVDQRQLLKCLEGYKFTAGHKFESVANGATVNVLLHVPDDAERMIFFLAFEVSSDAKANIDLYFDVEFSGGTNLKIINLRRKMEGVIDPVAVALHSVTYTPSEYHLGAVHTGGVRQFATGGLSELSGAAILDPGYNVLIAVTNNSGSAQDISLRLVWWEEPV